MVWIYYLEKNDIPFYIGKTKNLRSRRGRHRSTYGKNINLNELDQVPINEWVFWERHYISLFKSWGFNLINQNEGGGGPTKYTEESKNKMKLSWTLERREKISNLSSLPKSDEHKKRIGLSLKNKKRSKEVGINISLSKKGKSSPRKGKILKDSTKLKMSISKKKLINLNKHFLKPIDQFELCGKYVKSWDSPKEAGFFFKIDSVNIRAAARGKQKTAGGFKWKYK